MQVHILNQLPSVLNHFLQEMRDVHVQKDRLRFRTNLERIGSIMAYEISKALPYQDQSTQTPLGKISIPLIKEQPILATILRAGLPLHQGISNFFDYADHAYISAFRKHTQGHHFDIELKYFASPSIDNKVLILSDPMLASGLSIVSAIQAIEKQGVPSQIHIACVIASEQGVQFLKKELPDHAHLWIAAVDPHLDENSYIVPGLGDAGDLAFGQKL